MTNSTSGISRRNVLRGLGVSMALPILESVAPRAAFAAAPPVTPPQRMAFIFVPNGVDLANWTPTSDGYGYQLPQTLTPLKH